MYTKIYKQHNDNARREEVIGDVICFFFVMTIFFVFLHYLMLLQ